MVSTRQRESNEIVERKGIAAHVMLMHMYAENLGQADYRRDSHGGAISPWLAYALLTVIGKIDSGYFDILFDYGSGDRLGVLLTGWILAWNRVVRMVGIEKDGGRRDNGVRLLTDLNERAGASHVLPSIEFDLHPVNFLEEDESLQVPQGRRAIVFVNNFDDCMLDIRGTLEEALSRNLTEGSVVICFSRLFRPYDGRWTEEKFLATITADGLSWSSGGEEDEKKIKVFKYTRSELPAREGTVLTVTGRREGRTCHTNETEEVNLLRYKHMFQI